MAFQDLINQIEKFAEEEIDSISKENHKEIEKIDKEFKERIKEIEKSLFLKLEKERKDFFTRQEEEKDFYLKMNFLSIKKEIIDSILVKAKKEINNFSSADKKEIIKDKLLEIKNNLGNAVFFTPVGTVSKARDLINELGIKDLEIKEKEGIKEKYIIESNKIVIDLSISSIFDEAVTDNYSKLVNILFL